MFRITALPILVLIVLMRARRRFVRACTLWEAALRIPSGMSARLTPLGDGCAADSFK